MYEKSRFYPYLVTIIISIYLTVQFLNIASTSNIGVTLEEVSKRQKTIFTFLINESIESATEVASYNNIVDIGVNDKERLLRSLSYNKNKKIYDVVFLNSDLEPINELYEDIALSQMSINLESIIEPTVFNIRYSKFYNDTVMDIFVPVFEKGKIKCFMWQVESFERINYAMKNVSFLNTGESYIIDENGKVLTDLKYSDLDTVTIKNKDILNSYNDGFEKNAYLDYKENYVYGYHSNLNLNGWKLIIEVNESDVINTTTNINSFMIHSVSMIIAASKILEPVIKKGNIAKSQRSIKSDKNSDYKECKFYIKSNKFYNCIFVPIFNKYKKYRWIINNSLFFILLGLSILTVSYIKIDNDIQTNIDSNNKINTNIINYYLSEIESDFYFMNRTLNEFEKISIKDIINNTEKYNSNILNIEVLNNENKIMFNSTDEVINLEKVVESIKNRNLFYNSIGKSKIFFDKNYNQNVFYLTGKVLDHNTQTWINTVCVVSVDRLINMLIDNEIYSSRNITILKDKNIMYSNKYKIKRVPNYYYEIYQKSNRLNKYSETIFDINKYKNIEDKKVYGSYIDIKENNLLNNGNYTSISDDNWGILYEEYVNEARQRVFKSTLDLLIRISYEYIQKIVVTIS